MMDSFDVLLVDLQDLGCRIYTFITTLRYVLEAAAKHGKAVWVLDRPNPVGPAGRGTEPARRAGRASSARARCRCATASRSASSRTGSSRTLKLDVDYRVIADARLGARARRRAIGWPLGERAWVNPSPERAEPVDGALLCRHGDARRHDAFGRPRHRRGRSSSSARRTSTPRALARRDAIARARTGCTAAACGRAGSSRRSTSTPASSVRAFRSTSRTAPTIMPRSSPWRLIALAFKALRTLRPGLRALARFRVRVRARPARDRRDQRRASCCASGSTIRPRRRRPGCAGRKRTKTRGATSADRFSCIRLDDRIGAAPSCPGQDCTPVSNAGA